MKNENNHAQFTELRRKIQGPPIIAVSGIKNSGKTTLLSHLIPLLHQAGLRVGLIKHDSHDFEPDVPGTDSYVLRQAGAELVAVYSDNRYMVTANQTDCCLDNLLKYCQDLDLLILEGGKYTNYPKIEVVRAAISASPVCDQRSLLALCTDTGFGVEGVPVFRLDEYEAMANLLLQYLRGEYYPDTSAGDNPARIF